ANFKCMACGYRENADVVGARNIKVRGQRMSACGELGEVGRAQVNQRMETIHGAGQQQEPIEVISGASH
ncbi:transposase, partial [Parasutterella secunda]|nr:transposase [Parasutterella secunda]